jgi:hypothetical protein
MADRELSGKNPQYLHRSTILNSKIEEDSKQKLDFEMLQLQSGQSTQNPYQDDIVETVSRNGFRLGNQLHTLRLYIC